MGWLAADVSLINQCPTKTPFPGRSSQDRGAVTKYVSHTEGLRHRLITSCYCRPVQSPWSDLFGRLSVVLRLSIASRMSFHHMLRSVRNFTQKPTAAEEHGIITPRLMCRSSNTTASDLTALGHSFSPKSWLAASKAFTNQLVRSRDRNTSPFQSDPPCRKTLASHYVRPGHGSPLT